MDETYAEGFRQGFRAIRGNTVTMPTIPTQPTTKTGRTPFQMGIMRGIEKGKRWERGDLLNKE